jgi:basic membrane protein A
LLLLVAITAACAPAGRDATRVRIGMVTDVGGLGDHSYNDAAYAGLTEARDTLGVGINVLQPQSDADFQAMLAVLGARDDETFAVGYSLQEDLREVAARTPRRHFSIIDAVVDAPNITSITFKEEEGSFLAGAAAALASKTKTLGFLGGQDAPLIRKFEAGYIAGAHQIDPSERVLVKYVGDFNDVASGAELTAIMFDQGAGVVYTAAGKAGLGAFQVVRGRSGVFVIGVNSDQDAFAPGKVLTSMLKRVDVAVYTVAKLAAARKPRPARLVLGVAEDGVGLTTFRYTRSTMTPARIAQLARIKAAIIGGRIRVPVTREEAAAYARVSL